MEHDKDLAAEVRRLRELVEKVNLRYTTPYLFFGGILRGAGIIVGATLVVLVGSTVLSLLGLLPGLSDVVKVILDAFDKARVQ